MLIEIKDNYEHVRNLHDKSADFFIENGVYIEQDGYLSEEDKTAGKIAPRRCEYRFVGHIEQVPIDILNHHSSKISYFKGMKSFVERAVGSNIGETQSLNYGAVNIHLPSIDLFAIDETLILEDSCTDSLQSKLDESWRIIACIPRPGQRRPDYILGRVKQ